MDEQLMAPGVGGDRGCPRVVGRFDGAAGGADNRDNIERICLPGFRVKANSTQKELTSNVVDT